MFLWWNLCKSLQDYVTFTSFSLTVWPKQSFIKKETPQTLALSKYLSVGEFYVQQEQKIGTDSLYKTVKKPQIWCFRWVSWTSWEQQGFHLQVALKHPFEAKQHISWISLTFSFIPNIFTGPFYSLFRQEWIVAANKCFSDGRQVLHEAWTDALISILRANITQAWEQWSAVPWLTLLRGFLDDIFDF